MLYNQRVTTHLRRPARLAAPTHLLAQSARLRWGTWRASQSTEPVLLTSAELSECTCPDICHRDHEVD